MIVNNNIFEQIELVPGVFFLFEMFPLAYHTRFFVIGLLRYPLTPIRIVTKSGYEAPFER